MHRVVLALLVLFAAADLRSQTSGQLFPRRVVVRAGESLLVDIALTTPLIAPVLVETEDASIAEAVDAALVPGSAWARVEIVGKTAGVTTVHLLIARAGGDARVEVGSVEVLAHSRQRPVRRSGDTEPLPQDILWIGAHPDDEVLVAPVLAEICRGRSGSCSIITATRGERGECLLEQGCLPDVKAVRTEEAINAATFVGADLLFLDLPDGAAQTPEGVIEEWGRRRGGVEQLVDDLARLISLQAPQTVLTFDPRHGSTGHGDHRAIGCLVLRAAERLGDAAPNVVLLETSVTFGDPGLSFAPAFPGVEWFDASLPLTRFGDVRWSATTMLARIHASQFDYGTKLALDLAEAGQQRVYLAPADNAAREACR